MDKDPKGKKRPALAISFRTYVRGHPREDSPAGNFIADANADKSFPEIAAWKDLKSYLHRIGAADAAMVPALTTPLIFRRLRKYRQRAAVRRAWQRTARSRAAAEPLAWWGSARRACSPGGTANECAAWRYLT